MSAPAPEISARTRPVAAAIFLMTAAFMLAKTGRDALFFMGNGLYDLPKAYVGIALLALPMAAVALALMKAVRPRRARVAAPLALAVALAVFFRVATPGGGPLNTVFFMVVPLAFGVAFSLAWLLAADLLDGTPRAALARAHAEIGAASILGGVMGGLIARVLARMVEPELLVLLAAGALVASAAVMAWAQRRFPTRAPAPGGVRVTPDPVSVRAVLRQPYTWLLMLVAMAAALVGVLVEFQFYVAAGTSGHGSRENASFFASAYLALNASALILQLGLLPALQRSLGLKRLLLVLPGALVGGGAALLVSATMATRSLMRIAEGGLKSSVHRTSWEQAYLPLERAHRPVAKLLVDGAGARVAEGAAATILYLWLRWRVGDRGVVGQDIVWITWALLGALALWLALTRALGRRLAAAAATAGAAGEFRPDVPLPDT